MRQMADRIQNVHKVSQGRLKTNNEREEKTPADAQYEKKPSNKL